MLFEHVLGPNISDKHVGSVYNMLNMTTNRKYLNSIWNGQTGTGESEYSIKIYTQKTGPNKLVGGIHC